MCLAVPAQVVALQGDVAWVDLDGIRKEVSTQLLDAVDVGDYVLIHVGFALERIDPVEAEETIAMLNSLRIEKR